jgi:L-fucose isomerase-like protein
MKKNTFALFFGNRGFFPASLMQEARQQLPAALKAMGHDCLMTGVKATRHGAVETFREGKIFADFLRKNHGRYDGIIICLPNFGDENGALAAMRDEDVPIFIMAYPDDLEKMGPASRRDAFCGKLSIMDVFVQSGIKFTALAPHTVNPQSGRFNENIDHFAGVCRVVKGVKGMVVGAIGARTTPFKTVRFDETTLQRHNITVETIDLSAVLRRIADLPLSSKQVKAKAKILANYASWQGVPRKAFENSIKLAVVLDELIKEFDMDAVAVRCWTEFQLELGISPCVILSLLNNTGTAAACEVDVGNAIMMHALGLASGSAPACLDWNNNYGEEDDKCILFHCGPIPAGMMKAKGRIQDHAIIANSIGKGRGFGCNTGRIAPGECTFGSLLTDGGKIKCCLGEGNFTDDAIPDEFFGCAGVVEIENLQNVLIYLGQTGYRHHVSVTRGHVANPVYEALSRYLGFEVARPQTLVYK